MKPIVTVLMTVYNGKNYLNEAVESVLCQTLTNYEFLIVDDASTDNTVDILKEMNCTVIQHHKNTGKGSSIIDGIRVAKGEYILFMDGDGQDDPSEINKLMNREIEK